MSSNAKNRVESIDNFRGFAIILMFIANFIVLFVKNPPDIIRHAEPGMILPLDFVAPFFGFAIGLSFPYFIYKTKMLEATQPAKRFFFRVIILYIVGASPNFLYRLMIFEESVANAYLNSWSILETWALGLCLIILLVKLNLTKRIFVSVAILFIYQFVLLEIPGIYSYVYSQAEGGVVSVLSWLFVIINGTVIGELIVNTNKLNLIKKSVLISLLNSIVGLALHFGQITPMTRLDVSASYMFFSAGISIFVFLLFHLFLDNYGKVFREVGMYPLQAWILQSLFYVPVYLTIGGAYFDWPVGGVIALFGVVTLVIIDKYLIKLGIKLKA
ncbi:heparan-alpha-glucosaminide N-acetyltransferase domain-containing protein [Natranaerofaba carboxydovora]|uniref:heparan-alpha-glucosaminide N-acetyltransferase domain-containing protein n=1 Tax=Natranaerofaba carboxydovora TaxID=2742683 RepID=UPI001F131940|nr:heparan-alpha-glucosaminide N-acetyltransferase domain-containing protein [Natranaerofaba carboxydovora]UMZ73855.1 hypothetical protein ACONDI_01425 [Natranaerofaba carboxydovora]